MQALRRASADAYMPPYAAYVRPAPVGCSVSSHSNSINAIALGTNHHFDAPLPQREVRQVAAHNFCDCSHAESNVPSM